MIIIELCGGLGNQLQQYALYRKFISLGVDARIDTSWFGDDVQKNVSTKRRLMLDAFCELDYKVCTIDEKTCVINQGGFEWLRKKLGLSKPGLYYENSIYDPKVLKYTNKYLEGAFTCEYYYSDILPELREELQFPVEEYRNKNELFRVSDDIRQNYSIALHIRRGDYLNDGIINLYGNICTEEYYLSALYYALNTVDVAKLYVFSDDTEYAEEFVSTIANRFGKRLSYEVISFNIGDDSLFDIYLMSLCNCVITANSTFSYWGARLNRKENAIRIRPTKHKNSQEFEPDYMLKLWPGWIFVDPEGKVYGYT